MGAALGACGRRPAPGDRGRRGSSLVLVSDVRADDDASSIGSAFLPPTAVKTPRPRERLLSQEFDELQARTAGPAQPTPVWCGHGAASSLCRLVGLDWRANSLNPRPPPPIGVRIGVLQRLLERARLAEENPGPPRTWRSGETPVSQRAAGEALTTEDVYHELIAPIVLAANLRTTGSYVDVLRQAGRSRARAAQLRLDGTAADVAPAGVYVIHAWTCTFADLVAAIQTGTSEAERASFYLDLLSEAHGLPAAARGRAAGEDDAPSAAAHSTTKPPEWWLHTLRPQIEMVSHVLVVISPWRAPGVLVHTRSVYEIDAAAHAGALLRVSLPQAERRALYAAIASEESPNAVRVISDCLDALSLDATLAVPSGPGGEAEREGALAAVRRADSDDAVVGTVQVQLGEWLCETAAKALAVFERDEDPAVRLAPLELREVLASLHKQLGRPSEAERLLRRQLSLVVQQQWSVAGGGRPTLGVGGTGGAAGDDANASPTRAFHASHTKALITHPLGLSALNALALLLRERETYNEAEDAYRLAVTGCEHRYGRKHRYTLKPLYNLAVLLKVRGRHEEAVPLFRRVLRTQRADTNTGDDASETAATATNLAATVLLAGDATAEAEECARLAYNNRLRKLGAEHDSTVRTARLLIQVLERRNKRSQADALRRKHLSSW